MKKIILIVLSITMCLASVLALSCSEESESAGGTPFAIASSELERDSNPEVSDDDFGELIEGNGQFALDLYAQLKDEQEGNFFYSPHSISIALAMTYAGAKGNTRTEMGNTLHFTLEEETLHSAFNKLDLTLSSPKPADNSDTDTNRDTETGTEENDFVFRTANSLWAEQTYTFLDSFLDPLALNYGAGVNLMDFLNQPEPARQTINAWVEEQTDEKIIELLPEGIINSDTKLVLTNAVYFYGSWMYPFWEDATADAAFTLLDGSTISVPTMASREEEYAYADRDGYIAVQLPYVAERIDPMYSSSEPMGYEKAGMLIIMPDAGNFESFENRFNIQMVSDIVEDMMYPNMIFHMPKWEFRSEFQMKATLQAMGMVDAFQDSVADFSGMDGTGGLFLGQVVHQAFVAVDENGTEAAASTAVIMQFVSAPPPPIEVRINRPFIFLIRDLETGAILFAGRVLNPEA